MKKGSAQGAETLGRFTEGDFAQVVTGTHSNTKDWGIIRLNKYKNKETVVDGIKFQSLHEAHRYCELKYMERAHLISGLQLQRRFTLLGAQKDETGKVIERPLTYVADFVYKDQNGKTVVEDAKGMKTDVYKIKRKLMLSIYGIRIVEV